MEFTRKQRESLKNDCDNETTLEELLNQFPEVEMFIIMGWDRYAGESYVKDVYFNKLRAQEEMAKIPLNGTPNMCDTYHIITATFQEFENKKIKDGNLNLDRVHLKILSSLLKEAIKELH